MIWNILVYAIVAVGVILLVAAVLVGLYFLYRYFG